MFLVDKFSRCLSSTLYTPILPLSLSPFPIHIFSYSLSLSFSLSFSLFLFLSRFLFLSLPPLISPWLQEPTLRLCVIFLKYADWRRAFIVAWKDVGELGCDASAEDRAGKVLQALEATCRAMHLGDDENRSDESKAWADNLGHHIAYVSSPLSFLARLGVVRKCDKGPLRLGSESAKFRRRLCAKSERLRVRRLLVKWVHLADAIGCVEAPKTCQDWVEQFGNLQQTMREHRAALLRRWGVQLMLCFRDRIDSHDVWGFVLTCVFIHMCLGGLDTLCAHASVLLVRWGVVCLTDHLDIGV